MRVVAYFMGNNGMGTPIWVGFYCIYNLPEKVVGR